MLEELSIKNYALIEGFSVTFQKGFTVLTGETGAGKSILVGSLSFLLGAKAGAEVVRTGADSAEVSAVISVNPQNRDALAWLSARDIALDEGRLIVRRTMRASGRGSMYLQNIPVPRGDLAECMGLLFDLHGQHSHESLLKKESHRKYLDRFAGLEEEVFSFNRLYLALEEKKKKLEKSLSSEKDREARLALLRYAVEEIALAAPKPGETDALETEAQKLGDFEKLAAQTNIAGEALFDGEVSVCSLARKVRSALETAGGVDGKLGPLVQRFESAYYEIEDVAEEFRAYRDDLKYDPARLEAVEDRLAELYRLKKKYGPDETAVLAYLRNAETEIEDLTQSDENRSALETEIKRRERELRAVAELLAAGRTAGAERLRAGITEILPHLGMPSARFGVSLLSQKALTPWGGESAEFLLSANAGEPLKELARIGSGGELSRVMLAIKTALSGADALETLIFDEIDTGIGGEVAAKVGEYLAEIGRYKQIFCVTHLASIAVRADNHIKVAKQNEAGRTATGVEVLRNGSRRREIARMLAGDFGAAAMAHADALLEKYQPGEHPRSDEA
ncbi:MAG: DNA repair protein RecN [Spirochaetaceae bacterium]|jgi:DNA repair protein RecN (Recombination protein N)|nr:DNA repair protein RecN [Spirochaetaceae bacterium]